ncbi:MAG: hypothetical protein ABIH34_06345 [Nanoarchaeota archaeon]
MSSLLEISVLRYFFLDNDIQEERETVHGWPKSFIYPDGEDGMRRMLGKLITGREDDGGFHLRMFPQTSTSEFHVPRELNFVGNEWVFNAMNPDFRNDYQGFGFPNNGLYKFGYNIADPDEEKLDTTILDYVKAHGELPKDLSMYPGADLVIQASSGAELLMAVRDNRIHIQMPSEMLYKGAGKLDKIMSGASITSLSPD